MDEHIYSRWRTSITTGLVSLLLYDSCGFLPKDSIKRIDKSETKRGTVKEKSVQPTRTPKQWRIVEVRRKMKKR